MKIKLFLAKALRFSPPVLGIPLLLAGFTGIARAEDVNSLQNQTPAGVPSSSPLLSSPAVPASTGDAASLSQIRQYSKDSGAKALAQVTSVSQLSDVQPTDWAFQALQSLVERYGCIAGYPNRTYRGNRPMSRYEFAAGLNACMDRVNELIASATADLVRKEDLESIKKLQEQFAAELATLRGRVDSLEARTKTLEAQQFSTTTKLAGQVLFSVVKLGGNIPVPAGLSPSKTEITNNVTFNSRATLSLLTSFSGKDLLITSLQGSNFGSLTFNGSTAPYALNLGPTVTSASSIGSPNSVSIFYLGYRFPFHKDKGTAYITAAGGELSDFTNALNPYFEDEGGGALSAFGLRNPIYRQINSLGGVNFSGTGAGINYKFTKRVDFGIGYLVPGFNAANPAQNSFNSGGGLFAGDYAAIAQLTFKPTNKLGLGLTYVRSYSKTPGQNVGFGGFIGTTRSIAPFNIFATSSDSAGFEFNWSVKPKFAIGGWVGATFANAETTGVTLGNDGVARLAPSGSSATILNYALTLAFPDLGAKGNLGGVIVGSQPQVISSSVSKNTDPNTNIHVEAFYRLKINNFISITPGGFVIINPEGNSKNDPIYATTIRTTFSF